MTSEALSRWLVDTEPGEAEHALLMLRAALLRTADETPHSCRELLDNIVLPALQNADEAFSSLLIAFRLVRARVSVYGDDAFRSEIEQARMLNPRGLVAQGLMEWAYWSQVHGQIAQADRLYDQAQLEFRALGCTEEAQHLYIQRTQLAPRLLEWSEAAEQILHWLEQPLLPEVAGRLHLELAQCQLRANQVIVADEHLCAATKLFAEVADPFGCYLTQAYRALWFWHLGAYDRASKLLDVVHGRFEELGRVREAEIVAANRASVRLASSQNELVDARELERLRGHFGQSDPLLWWQLTMNLAAAYERLGHFVSAARLYEELQRVGEVRAWERKLTGLNLAHLRISAGIEDGLGPDLVAALEDRIVQEDPFLLFLAYENMGDWHRSAHRHDAASTCYEAALDCVESSRVELPWEFLRRQLRQAHLRVFARLEASLLHQQAWEAAWQVADRAKGQSFADFLQGPYPALDRVSRLAFLRARRPLTKAYRREEHTGTTHNGIDMAVASEVTRLEYLLDETLSESRRHFPPANLLEPWQQWPALQSEEVALLEFSQCAHGLGMYLVRAGRVFYQQLIPSNEIDRLYARIKAWWQRHRKATAEQLSEESWRAETEQWTRLLLAGFSLHLEGVQRLLVVPDGVLSLVPWAGLWDSESAMYLYERFPAGICILPGTRFGQLLSQRQPGDDAELMVVVQPSAQLLDTALEARWISNRLGETCQLLQENEVTHAALRRLLPRCHWFHYAGHGVFNQDLPMASHLKLTGGQRWTGWDMLAFPLPATTVVLSACEVGSTAEAEAGEWLGLLRGFFLAGASAAIAPLWEVTDLGSLALMQAFYQHVTIARGEKVELARALMLAQAEVRALGRWALMALARLQTRHNHTWQDTLDPQVSFLIEPDQPELSQRAIALLKATLDQWRQKSPAGRYASEEQIRYELLQLMGELSILEHPRHWSLFQLYGDPEGI